jgi:hypothetical protein
MRSGKRRENSVQYVNTGLPKKFLANTHLEMLTTGHRLDLLTFNPSHNLHQSINVSCNSHLEHRASTTHRHRTLFFAATFTPLQFRPTALFQHPIRVRDFIAKVVNSGTVQLLCVASDFVMLGVLE